jgi:DNA-directed RNA polymerase subunit omega
MVEPQLEDLIAKVGSKFELAILAAKRARQLNDYFSQLGHNLGAIVPPQVASRSSKPVSMAFEEIAAGKIIPVHPELGTSGDQSDALAHAEEGTGAAN